MGLSLVAMVAAAFGLLPAALGALLQEAIDVAVILNALRVAFEAPAHVRLAGDDAALGLRFSGEHDPLRNGMETIRQAADALGTDPAGGVAACSSGPVRSSTTNCSRTRSPRTPSSTRCSPRRSAARTPSGR